MRNDKGGFQRYLECINEKTMANNDYGIEEMDEDRCEGGSILSMVLLCGFLFIKL
jgi:hypothetical protein